jgi:hypothetical protein
MTIDTFKPDIHLDCYRSVLRFTEDLLTYRDSNRNKHGDPSVEEYKGAAKADFLYFDLDCKDCPERALEDARELLRTWAVLYDLPLEAVRIFFTGYKGFAIEIPGELFGGLPPSEKVAAELKLLATRMAEDRATFDEVVYNLTRLWRVPSTRHGTSGLYKIPLAANELFSKSFEEIKELAQQPRCDFVHTDPSEFSEVPALRDLYLEASDQVSNLTQNKQQKTFAASNGESPGKFKLPQRILSGQRNDTLFRYACSLRTRGALEEEIFAELCTANAKNCDPPLERDELAGIAASATRYEPGNASSGASPEVHKELDEFDEELRNWEFKGKAGQSQWVLMQAAIRIARQHGTLIPAGVRVVISRRAWAEEAGVSDKAVERNVPKMKQAGLIRTDNATRKGAEAGAIVLLVPRANRRQSSTESVHGGFSAEKVSAVDLRALSRLRPSAPWWRRLGPQAGRVLELLLMLDGSATVKQLGDALHLSRPRDLKRPGGVLHRLEEAEMVECVGQTVCLRNDWREALDRAREVGGEIVAQRLQRARHERDRARYLWQREGSEEARRAYISAERRLAAAKAEYRASLEGGHEESIGLEGGVVNEQGELPSNSTGPLLELGAVGVEQREDSEPQSELDSLPVAELEEPDWLEHPLDCECISCTSPVPRFATPLTVRRHERGELKKTTNE